MGCSFSTAREVYGLTLIEQSKRDIAYISQRWNTLNDEDLLSWFHTIIVMNQNGLYLPFHHVVSVWKPLQQSKEVLKKEVFISIFLQKRNAYPSKGLIPKPDTKQGSCSPFFHLLSEYGSFPYWKMTTR